MNLNQYMSFGFASQNRHFQESSLLRKLLRDTFLNMGFADEAAFDEELTYYMHCCEASRAYYCSKDMEKKPVEIVVEIQYMLQSYFDMRKYTHTWYKIVRAEDPEALVVDYNS